MKTSIPSDVWEKKRSLIAKLYKDEEWPLKQVIKQIRTEDFNPSETQLRSRLKKWRVTKPSRQARKKPQEGQHETDADDDGQGGQQEKTSPVDTNPPKIPTPQPPAAQPQLQQPVPPPSQQGQQKELPSSAEWYDPNEWFARQTGMVQQEQQPLPSPVPFNGQNVGNNWVSPRVQQQSMMRHEDGNQFRNRTPVMQQYSTVQTAATPNPYDQSHPVTAASNSVAVTAMPMMAPTYASHTYTIAPETCGPTNSPTTTVQWPTGTQHIELDVNYALAPMPDWYTAALDAANQTPVLPYYGAETSSSPIAGYPHAMQSMPRQDTDQMYSRPPLPFPGDYSPESLELLTLMRPWKRARASEWDPAAAGGHARVDRQGRQRKAASERKRKASVPTTSAGVMTPQPQAQFVAHEQHPMVSTTAFPYPRQEPLVHKPPGSGQ